MQFSLYNKFAVWDHSLLCVFVSKLIIHQSVSCGTFYWKTCKVVYSLKMANIFACRLKYSILLQLI